MKKPIVLLTGDDPTLINEALRSLIEKALDGQDRSLALEELNETAYLRQHQRDLIFNCHSPDSVELKVFVVVDTYIVQSS